uniref:DoxX family protein n=1 Tax=Meloidogyne hapla TaxID=6305 RepID=A0A1I8B843_MELHA
MFLTALFVGLMRISVIIFFAMQYSGGGIKQFDEVINETIPFVQNNMVT